MKPMLEEEGRRFLAGPGCPQLLKVSKHLVGPLELLGGNPCKCECKAGGKMQLVFQVNYRAVLRFSTAKPCDETELEPLLHGGTELWLDGVLTVRQDACRKSEETVLIGRNAGKYVIHRYRPNEDIMQGPFCGTEGLLATEEGERRCCAPGHGLGSFCGDGFGRLAGWSLCAGYHSLMRGLNPETICDERTIEVEMDLDGVLIGPCKGIGTRQKP